MEKICEFCTTSRPVAYCKADAAHMCLSCDSKVHSANTLSNRHLCTLLCDSCRYCPSYVRCLDHRLFICHGCDQSVHVVSSQHQRCAVSSYLGCPSAKDFAALWGFELNEVENNAIQDHSLSNSHVSMNPNVVKLDNLRQSCSRIGVSLSKSSVTSMPAAGCNVGSNSQYTKSFGCGIDYSFLVQICSWVNQHKVISKGQQQQNASFILQQILDLKKLQLTEGDSHLPFIGGLEQADTSSSIYPMPWSFTHLENLPSSSTSGRPLYGESFWQCKSAIRNSKDELQFCKLCCGLKICKILEFVKMFFYQDDFHMPDIDLTFRNFEDHFASDQDPIRAILGDKDVSCSYVEKDIPFNKSDNGSAKPMEDASVASSVYAHPEINMDPSNHIHNFQQIIGSPCPIQPSYSTMSFSVLRFSAESSGTECLDSGLSPIAEWEASCISPNLDSLHSEAI
ncbi:hypothetical protein CRYUN_Cryun06bG0105600 [Craigia yunnanensis]